LSQAAASATTGAILADAPVLPSAPPGARVVLDTNVLLSLYVFPDSGCRPIRAALEDGRWLALTDARCLREFRRIVARPMFGLDAAAQEAAVAAYAAHARVVEPPAAAAAALPPLPQCRDRDDQKFLELARDGGAQLLVTSDRALLKLARRQRLAHLFRIVTPTAALALLAPGPSGDSAIFAPGGSGNDAHCRAGGHP
jgi:putative PIN family toxin of toxin-antitoxin system